jgi:signal transduction histidine kinase
MSNAVASRPERFVTEHPQWWLGGMLLGLHAALAWGIDDWWPRAFLLAHVGLFLLWQPVWRGERDVQARHAFLVVTVGVLLAAWNNWWLMAVWLAVLFGLIGGSVPGIMDRRQRLTSILAAVYLLSLLLVWVVPHLFADQSFETALVLLVRYGLPLLPLSILFIRVESARSEAPVAVDLFYSVLLFLLVVALVLGSFVVKEVSHGQYVIALAQALFMIALLLVALSWLWNPHGGFAGVGHMLSRYLMSLGLPFERWVQRLADLADQESQPQRFLAQALQHMLDLPWVTGIEWKSRTGQGEFGTRAQHTAELSFQELSFKVHTHWALSPAVLLHLRLLTQMVGHFYEAKEREQIQRQNAYAQAIYETGARLTHDVKNLLQSMRSLCAAAESAGDRPPGELSALIQRQLPQITQRLNQTLDKLKMPENSDVATIGAPIWWQNLIHRHSGRNIHFHADGSVVGLSLPGELFDSVADNLIQNALKKTAQTAGLSVRVTFSAAHGGTLTVCDDGAAIPKTLVPQLFESPVPSRSGYGIGLYQSAKQAVQQGYRVALAANEPGLVCFILTGGGET